LSFRKRFFLRLDGSGETEKGREAVRRISGYFCLDEDTVKSLERNYLKFLRKKIEIEQEE
jgi:hypothetical protein